MGALEDIYTAEWFAHDFAELQPEFDVVADSLVRQFAPKTAQDIGCGPGPIVRRLRKLGVAAFGIEGSRHGIEYAHPDVLPFLALDDITTMRCLSTATDLVICTEVAEHLDAKDAPGLVALLCSAMCPIVWTAAPPGQDGHHHVNCQPEEYWTDLFLNHGVIQDDEATAQLTARWRKLKRLSHMTNNVVVWR